jgi:hypothetical protein
MSLIQLPNENLIDILNYLDYESLINFKFVSRKLNENVKYFINKKVKNIKDTIENFNDENNLLKLRDFSDFYLQNLIWHLNDYKYLSFNNVKFDRKEIDNNNFTIRYIKNDNKVTINYKDNNKIFELWISNNTNCNNIGPSLRKWSDNGCKDTFNWYKNGFLHNENGPAILTWYKNGNKKSESYYLNGKLQNLNKETHSY